MKIKNILLSGGSGKRLWPLSRSLYPKQFLKLFGNESLFKLSFKRNASLVDETLIVCNEKHYFFSPRRNRERNQKQKRGFFVREFE
ncbi:hypothetical protein JSHR3_01520 [Helicobacter pylori]|nr:hypothetical protein JSHR3_01520 [Helicobacter pylori]